MMICWVFLRQWVTQGSDCAYHVSRGSWWLSGLHLDSVLTCRSGKKNSPKPDKTGIVECLAVTVRPCLYQGGCVSKNTSTRVWASGQYGMGLVIIRSCFTRCTREVAHRGPSETADRVR
ncbi:uncharacterized protein YALI1_F09137g [Yarrowia lipolytica]|uniref:Uncharacterized protein n=1 Tax=Yarrowia lipolytica TaxID=4952 RepID=A0A1D8NM92_YARLL|nr:hypothetical protein YALI1_F09137g [Yarrowia lipolytica]